MKSITVVIGMSTGKPMGKKMRGMVAHALENALSGECVGISETEEGTHFKMKINITKTILIPDK